MTINDQITDEKLRYDIDRKAAKISAKSSGKLHRYEYLTGEDILPSNQQQIIEQTKFTYSSLGKAFEKQVKTIEDQGEKQVKAIQDKGKIKTIQKYASDAEDTPLISKQKEIFNKLVDERRKQITDLDEKVNRGDLIYRCKGNSPDLNFNEFDNALTLIGKIRDRKIGLADVKNNQEKCKSYLREIKKRNNKRKSQEQKNTLHNIEILYKARNEAITYYDYYSLIMSEAKIKSS